MNNVNIFALGGQDENGKNCYVFEHNDNIFVINSGAKVPIDNNNGVDTLIPDFSYLEKNAKKIKAIFITDIKNETFSAIPWLVMKLPNVKIYTTAFNRVMILDRLGKYNINSANIKVISAKDNLKFNDLNIKFLPLTGSIPGNFGIDFTIDNHSYFFAFNFVEGDLGIYGKTNFDQLASYFKGRKLSALISDAGKSHREGRAIDNFHFEDTLEQAFLETSQDNRIIVGAYDEEMVSIQKVLDLAIKHNRPVAAYGKTYADLLLLLSKVSKNTKFPDFIDLKQINKTKNAVVLVTASTERLYARFTRILDNKDIYLKIQKTDTFILMAPPVNGLESQCSFVLDEVTRITPKLFDISDSKYFYVRPTRDDLTRLIQKLKPDVFIPTQGLYRYLVDACEHVTNTLQKQLNTKMLVLLNGKIGHFIDNKLFSHNGKVKEVGNTIIDGFGIGDISSEVIAEREALGREGVIIINGVYSPKTKKIIGQLHITYLGVIDKPEQPETNKLIKTVILDVLKTKGFPNMRELNERVRKTIRKKIFKVTDKDPLIALTLISNI
ncbi:ribonuclease J [Mycoplasma nasistruthionis]|uniref:Ribonuclease J n=1 Tax=Mycoplasma nasistruthionis TaxID=353852 RepID=A0A5B7XVV0_9MOLU|nr:ribonuclease J [Mycoplasma nasistruthionis]QCZ36837.1 ribonuclease J [Mycoplasma nasistruthionis]